MSLLLRLGVHKEVRTKLGDAAIHMACQQNKHHLVKILLKWQAEVNCQAAGGKTPLHAAVDRGATQCADALFDPSRRGHAPVKVNAVNDKKQTPLHIAAWKGLHELCDLLINLNATVDAVDVDGSTPLTLAIRKNHVQAVKTLIRKGADRERRNRWGSLPMQQACTDGSTAVLKALKDMHLDPPKDTPPHQRPLALAQFYGHKDIVEILSVPPPESKLSLTMPRPQATAVQASYAAMLFEPVVQELIVWVAEKQGTAKLGRDARVWEQMFANAFSMVVEPTEKWGEGYHVNVEGLKPSTTYLLRLQATNSAGTAKGKPIEVTTKAEDTSRLAASRKQPAKAAEDAPGAET